jgi:hypothetical protein
MYCPQCGGTNESTARFCNACGLDLNKYREQWRATADAGTQSGYQPPAAQAAAHQAPASASPAYQAPYQPTYQYPGAYQPPPYRSMGGYAPIPRVPSYMGWAIAVLIVCFWPTGIAAVVFASQVGEKLGMGDIAGAQRSSHKAKMWCWITFGISLAGWVILGIIWAVALSAAVTIY